MAAPWAPADVLTGTALSPALLLSNHHHSLTFSKMEKLVFSQFSELICLDQWHSMWFDGGGGVETEFHSVRLGGKQ